MRAVSICFSPTGGTKRVAGALAEALPGEKLWLDLTDPAEGFLAQRVRADDLTLIAMPVYGGRAPVLAMERFRKIRGNGSRCLLIAVYGNRDFEDTLAEMRDAAEEAGFRVTGAVAAVAEHSVARQFAAGRPDEADKQALRGAAEAFLKAAEKPAARPRIPGDRPYTKPMSLQLVPKRAKGCSGCGRCRAGCPAGAIREDLTADRDLCISCMRCVSVCPAGARKPSGLMVGLSAAVLKKECSKRKEIRVFMG